MQTLQLFNKTEIYSDGLKRETANFKKCLKWLIIDKDITSVVLSLIVFIVLSCGDLR